MTPETLLNGLGSLSGIIGLGIQLKELTGKEDKGLIALKSFEAITSVAFRWKHVHREYHILINDIAAINEFCLITNKQSVSIGNVSDVLKNVRNFNLKGPSFRREVNLYIDDDVRGLVNSSTAIAANIANIKSKFGNKTAVMAQSTFNAQKDVIASHDATCDLIEAIIRAYGHGLTSKNCYTTYSNMKALYKSFNQVINQTDKILINTIDFYELIEEIK